MYKKLVLVLVISTFVIFFSGCKPALVPTETAPNESQELMPTNTLELPTATLEPTATEMLPTPTATIEPSPTPEGQIFRDDFSGSLSPDWTIKNEQKGKWAITDEGFLQIVGQNDLLITAGNQNNLFCVSLPEGDFAAITYLTTSLNSNFQQAALYIYENSDNFVTINRGYCDLGGCETGGNGFYMDYKVNGNWGGYRVATSSDTVGLKLERVGTVLAGYYSNEPGEWQRLGRFGDLFELKEVCLGAGNGADVNSDIVAQFDYFEITKP
jgi:hypothetical protein